MSSNVTTVEVLSDALMESMAQQDVEKEVVSVEDGMVTFEDGTQMTWSAWKTAQWMTLFPKSPEMPFART